MARLEIPSGTLIRIPTKYNTQFKRRFLMTSESSQKIIEPTQAVVGVLPDDSFSSFFVQRLHEALFDFSADSFKAPALNTHLRVMELKRIGGQAEHQEFISASVDSFFDELTWSIQSDPILKGGKKMLIQELVARVKCGWGKSSQFLPAISALSLQFKDYLRDLIEGLREEAGKQKWSKEYVLKLLDALIVEFELIGYPRPYIFSVLKIITTQRRKKGAVKSGLETINFFLSHFTLESKKFSISGYVSEAISKALNRHKDWSILESGVPTQFASSQNVKIFHKNLDHSLTPIAVECKVEALCQHSAAKMFFKALDRLNEQIRFLDHHLPVHIHGKAFCVEQNSNVVSIVPQSLSPLSFTARASEDDLEQGLEILDFFFSKSRLSRPAQARLAQAIEYHGAALTSNRYEEQLLNLWSSLEGFVGVPSSAGSKISFVREAVLSCLTLQYPQRLFSLVANRVVALMGNDAANAFWTSTEMQSSKLRENLALVLLHPDLEAKRNELAGIIAKRDPVLLYRLFELRKRFENPKATKETLQRHREKIAWQMNRIYWNRNLIVHSAESLPYLPTLVEHLHIYVDSFLGSILYAVAKLEANTIPSVLELFSVHEKIRNTELTKFIESVPTENHLDWIFGRENLLRDDSGI